MSNLVDERVVEMSFDNSNFEKNTKQTISTINELKDSLDFSGTVKSINSGFDKVSMEPLTYGLENVKNSFSALEVVAISVIANLTNRITNLGIQIVESLSVDNIASGWIKYSENVKSVGTLLSQEGNTIEQVSEALNKLMWFTDQTSYSYTDMVSNISKFTATGQSLEDSVQAMMGIANWAALSGQNALTASRAMYQLSQAMGQGYIRLMDYKSIQNANMDTTEFRKNVLDTAVSMGYLVQTIDGVYTTTEKALEAGKQFTQGQFTTQLSAGWFTSDVLMSSLSKYSDAVDKLYEETQSGAFDTAAQAIEAYEQQLEEGGTEEEKFGLKAFKAAQEARTFEDVLNATKDAVSSGWLSTFDKIFGNYEESKHLWTDLADELWDVFAAGGALRNQILGIWKDLGGRELLFDKETGAFWNLFYAIKSVTDVIKLAWRSVFGLGQTLEDDSDYAEEAGNKLLSITKSIKALNESIKKFVDSNAKNIQNAFRGMFSILKVITKTIGAIWNGVKPIFGYLASESSTLLEFIGDIGDKFANLVNSTTIFSKISEKISAMVKTIVDKLNELEIIKSIVNIFKNFINVIKQTTANANVTSRVMKGLVAIFDILSQIGIALYKVFAELLLPAFKFIGKYAGSILGVLAGAMLKLLANIADLIVKIAQFLKTNDRFQNGINKIIGFLKKIPSLLTPIVPLIKGIGNILLKLLDIIVSIPVAISRLFESITGSSLGDVFKSLANTIGSAVNAIGNAIGSFGKIDTSGIDEFTGDVEPKLSPLQSLFAGLQSLFSGLFSVVKAVMPVIGAIFQLIGEGLTWIGNQLKNIFQGKDNPIDAIKDIFSIAFWTGISVAIYNAMYSLITFFKSISMIFGSVASVIDSKAMQQYADAFKTFSIAILLIVASLVLLASMDVEQLAKSLTALTIIVTAMVGVMKVFNKMFNAEILDFKEGILGFAKIYQKGMMMKSAATLMISFAAAIGILVLAMKVLGSMDTNQVLRGLLSLTALISLMVITAKILDKNKRVMSRGTVGLVLFAIATRLLVKPVKVLGQLDASALKRGLLSLGILMALFIIIGKIAKPKQIGVLSLFGLALTILSVALLNMSAVLAILAYLPIGGAWNAVGIITALSLVFVGISYIVKGTKLATLILFATAMMLLGVAIGEMVASIVILSAISVGAVWNGVGAITAFIAVMALVIKLVGIFSSLKLGIFATGMIQLGKAMLIYASVILILGSMEDSALKRGRQAVEVFILAMVGIIKLVGIFSSLKLGVFASGMILLGVAMLEFATVISILGSMDTGKLWISIAALVAIVTAMTLLSSKMNIKSSAGLAVMGVALITIAAGLIVLASALALIGAINWKTLLIGFGVLVVALGSLVVISKLLGSGVVVLLALGAAMVLISSSILILAAALGVIATVGAAAAVGLSILFQSLLETIINLGPTIAKAAETLITSLITAISNSLTKIFQMIGSLIDNVLKLLSDKGPSLINTIITILSNLLEALAKAFPSISKSIIKMVVDLLAAIKEQAGTIIQIVLDIVYALIDKLIENLPILFDKLAKLVIALVDGIVKTIVELVPKLISAAFDLILGLIEGLGQAIEDNAAKIRDTILSFCNHLWKAFLNFFGIHSPSKRTEEAGGNIILGIIKGILGQLTNVVRTLVQVGVKMLKEILRLPKEFLKAGASILKALWEGIKSVVSGFFNFLKSIWDWILSLFGVKSDTKKEFREAGRAMIVEYQDGMESASMDVNKTAKDVIADTVNTLSKTDVFKMIGESIVEQIANGIYFNSYVISTALTELFNDIMYDLTSDYDTLAESAWLTSYIDNILEIIKSDITDDDLTIKPVMDLSDVAEGTATIAGMLSSVGGYTYSMSGSTNLAQQAREDFNAYNGMTSSNSENNTTSGTVTGNGQEVYNVTFNISGADPKTVAEEVDRKLQTFVDRRNKQWA